LPDDVLELAPGNPMLTAENAFSPAPAPPAAPVDPLRQRMISNMDRQERLYNEAEKSIGQQSDIAEQKTRALAPIRERQLALERQPLPEIPKQKTPPPTPKRNDPQDDEQWLQAAMLLGALAGGLTRRHMTNALGAFQGAIEGYNEGSRQKFDQNMKLWEAANKKTIEENKMAMDHYKEIVTNRKLTNDQMSIELQLAAAQYDDQAMATAAKSKNTLTIAQLIDKENQSLAQFERASKGLAAGHADAKQAEIEKMAQQYAESPAGLARAKAIAEGRLPPPPTSQRTGFEGARNVKIMDKVLEFNPDFKATLFGANKITAETPARAAQGAEKIRATIDPMTARRTEIEFATGVAGRTTQSLNVAIDHLEALQLLAHGLQNNDINFINSVKNYFNKEFGLSDPTNFDAAKQIISQEVVKSVVANGGSMQERQEAERHISNARSPEQLTGIMDTYKRLMAGQMRGLQKRYESGGGTKDFQERLLPGTRREMERLTEEGIPVPASELRALSARISKDLNRRGMDAVTGKAREIDRELSPPQPPTPNMPLSDVLRE
jgi:hypothetical protein